MKRGVKKTNETGRSEHAHRNTLGVGAVRSLGTQKVAVRRVVLRRDVGQPLGVRRDTRVRVRTPPVRENR